MDKQKHIFSPGQRIRLKDGRDEPYKWATVGSEAIVKRVAYDDCGYPMAYIEWDQDHWTYNGEEDRWVFQTHFDPVGDPPMDESGMTPEDQAQFVKTLKSLGVRFDEDNEAKPQEPTRAELDDEYVQYMEYAQEELLDSESFLVVAIQRVVQDGVPMLTPKIITNSRTPQGALAVEAQLAMLLSVSHGKLVNQALARLAEEDDEQ